MYLEREIEALAISHIDENELSSDLRVIQKFEQLLEIYFKNHKKLEFYSESLGVSLRRLNGICINHLHKSLYELIQGRRFNESLKLLKFTELSVKEISYYLEFSGPPYFVRYFKKQTGLTPRSYRIKAREVMV
nr:AraC family transcriptional regulator [uncultured Pedobacter sp.]